MTRFAPQVGGMSNARTRVGGSPQWQSMSAEQLQWEYSPGSAIGGNYEPFIEQYIAQSDVAYKACTHVQTLVYGDKPTNSIDIALPDASDSCPLIVYIHGGYWQALSKKESFFGADWFASQRIAYAAIDYTLAPEASLAEIVTECRAAIVRIMSAAPSLGVDPDRVFLAGSSAGAHLTAICCCDKFCSQADHRPAGAILLSGIYELEPFVSISDNDAVGMTVEEAQVYSPLLQGTTTFPDAIVSWGQYETSEFKRQSLAMGKKLQQQRRSVQVFESPSTNHFDVVHNMANPRTRLGRCVLELVRGATEKVN